jgi:hypothetical protein
VFCRKSGGLLFCLFAFSTACTRDSQQVTPQLAILRFENLSGDPALDWMGRGFSEILASELEGSRARGVIQFPTLHAFDGTLGSRAAAPGISSERTQTLVAGANHAVYGYFSVVRGTLHATAVEEDLATHKVVQSATADGGIFGAADALARALGGSRQFDTRNPEALRAYANALDAPDAAAAAQDFAQATSADPGFGGAWLLWLDEALARHNRPEAENILALARAHADRFSEMDRATLDLDTALLHGDFSAQVAARRALALLDPANPNYHRSLAETLMRMRDYNGAIVEFRRGLTLRPDDILALNTMGYAAAFAGDLPTAIRVLRGYEQLRPKEPNPLDSLGDVHFALGHFGEAEQFYMAAHARSAAFLNGGTLLKAAQARLMSGDVAGATGLFHKYLEGRRAARDPNAPYDAAAWLWATGSRRAAIDGLEQLAHGETRADAQAALWLLELGNRERAAEHAQKLAEAGAANAPIAQLVAYLAQPDQASPPAQPALRAYARAYAMLFARQFQPAAEALQQIYAQPTGELDDGLGLLLAWAYVETGQWQKAEPLLRLTPLPSATGFPMFHSLYFPRLFLLRGKVLDHDGHQAQAGPYFKLFRTLSGADATIWDHDSAGSVTRP